MTLVPATLGKTRAPSTLRVVEMVRQDYLGGESTGESYLPGERELAARYKVARVTVRRALQKLTIEGLVRPEPGRGYRPLLRVAGLKPGSPAAYVVKAERDGSYWSSTSQELAAAMQQMLVEDGWQALTISTKDRSPAEVVRLLREAGVWGVALDVPEDDPYVAIHQSGLPCVSLDRLCRAAPVDNILQDNHAGGMLAAEYLLDRGHRRIAWFGQVGESQHSRERFTGAQSAFLERGLELPRELVAVPGADEVASARELLSRADRPTAVIALWSSRAVAIGRAAAELNLALGRDLDLVGWSTERGFAEHIERHFGPGRTPATVVWSTDEMARIAVTRLLWQVREPGLKPLRVSVPTRLVPPGQRPERAGAELARETQ